MKALSIHAPYAFHILSGIKTVEYRSWQPKELGDVVICTSVKNYGKALIHGHAIGIMTIDEVTRDEDGIFNWHISNTEIIEPFPVKGKLHLYDVPDEKIKVLPKVSDEIDINFAYYWLKWHDEGLCTIPDDTLQELKKELEQAQINS